jgi:hypothetical protein
VNVNESDAIILLPNSFPFTSDVRKLFLHQAHRTNSIDSYGKAPLYWEVILPPYDFPFLSTSSTSRGPHLYNSSILNIEKLRPMFQASGPPSYLQPLFRHTGLPWLQKVIELFGIAFFAPTLSVAIISRPTFFFEAGRYTVGIFALISRTVSHGTRFIALPQCPSSCKALRLA